MVAERIEALRAEMQKRNVDMYIVPTSDFHESEYVGDYFKAPLLSPTSDNQLAALPTPRYHAEETW